MHISSKPKLALHFLRSRIHSTTFVAAILLSIAAKAQEKEAERLPSYLDLSIGLNVSTFRDLATSPLFYNGVPISFYLGHAEMNLRRESSFRVGYSMGNFDAEINTERSESSVNIFSLNHYELFQISNWSSDRINVKVGGLLNGTAVVRNNPDLRNNGQGFDLVASLSGGFKGSYLIGDISNAHSTVSLGLFAGLVNVNYRNGFSYLSPTVPTNEDDLFADYSWNWFRGMRFSSELDYTFFLKNHNAIQLSYHWDAFATGSRDSDFEMANHRIELSLLFNLKY
jgi:hypothetical protein